MISGILLPRGNREPLMKKVVVATDSVSYIPAETAATYGIPVISAYVIIDGKSRPEVEVDLADFYHQMPAWKEANRLPTTSSPSSDDFIRFFTDLSREAESIVYIGYSDKLGMGISSAIQAKAVLEKELPQTEIEVINTKSACGAQILTAIETARLAAAGAGFAEVAAWAKEMVTKVNFVIISDDLYYLAKGGRIHRARPWAASRITNSVILRMDASTGGEHIPVARCRTKGEMLKALLDNVAQHSDNGKLHVAINHADVPAEAEELEEKARARFDCQEVLISNIGPLVTSHTGLGTRIFTWWGEN